MNKRDMESQSKFLDNYSSNILIFFLEVKSDRELSLIYLIIIHFFI